MFSFMKTNRPFGRNMANVYLFLVENKGWHTFNKKCRATVRAINSLKSRGVIQTNEYDMMSLA